MLGARTYYSSVAVASLASALFHFIIFIIYPHQVAGESLADASTFSKGFEHYRIIVAFTAKRRLVVGFEGGSARELFQIRYREESRGLRCEFFTVV